MDTNLIEEFRAVAQHLSMTRAAEALGTTQSQLSRSIRRLEDVVGQTLFDRSRRQIALTPAGEVFLAETQHILDRVSLAVRRTVVAAGGGRVLRVGYAAAAPDQPCCKGIGEFRRQLADMELDLVGMGAAEQTHALRSGALDVGLLQPINCFLHDLAWRTVGRTQFVLAVPADWPFPPDQPINLGALRDYPFVLSNPEFSPDIHASQVAYCQSAGFTPHVSRFGYGRAELMFLVAAGFGACFVFEPAIRIRMEGVRMMPIADPRPEVSVDFLVAWLAERQSPAVTRFIDCITAEAHQPLIVRRNGGFDLEWRRARFD